MSDYTAVTKALESGADPTMICRTCPWTRQCITLPEMTAADVKSRIAEMSKVPPEFDDPTADRKDKAMGQIMGSLLSTMMFAGADTKAQVCPVFAMRLREESGREIADSIRKTMAAWTEQVA